MNYPIPVMKIAADAPLLHYSHMETWQSLAQRVEHPSDLEYRIAGQAADAICKMFVGDVYKRGRITTLDEPNGKVVRFTCVALRHDQLLDLLYAAYREGQSDAIRSAPVAYVPQTADPLR